MYDGKREPLAGGGRKIPSCKGRYINGKEEGRIFENNAGGWFAVPA